MPPIHATRQPVAHDASVASSSAPLSTKLVVGASPSSPPSQHAGCCCNADGRCQTVVSTVTWLVQQDQRRRSSRGVRQIIWHHAVCSTRSAIDPVLRMMRGPSSATSRRRRRGRRRTRRHNIRSAAAPSCPQSISVCAVFVASSMRALPPINRTVIRRCASRIRCIESSPPSHHQDYRCNVRRRCGRVDRSVVPSPSSPPSNSLSLHQVRSCAVWSLMVVRNRALSWSPTLRSLVVLSSPASFYCGTPASY
jgi:hypothetical protein